MNSLLDRVALVTGASRGIGSAIAQELGRRGAAVAINFRQNAGPAEDVARQIESAGGVCSLFQADVADHESVGAMVKEIQDSLGPVSILVNNAGITRDGLIARMSVSDWQDVLDVNLTGAYNCIKPVLRGMMRQRWGRIINITSVVGLTGNAGQANYAAAKAGLIGLTKSLARELASRDITANAVAPGFIVTDMTANLGEPQRQALEEQIPVGRLGQPEDVAAVVGFLASQAAAYITGQVLAVDGGMTMD